MTDAKLLYPAEKGLAIDGLPETIRSAYDQADRAFAASLFEPCVLMCRKCLEATCRSLGAQGRDLKFKLQSLFDGGHIDSRLFEWSHEIRLIGNEPAHDTDNAVAKQDARDVLDFTEAILIYVFSLTPRFVAFRSRRVDNPGNA
jgi:Domain of unknown function (DUF4145)